MDTETNGRAGDVCELTEVGAVLVGGGELHESWGSLVRVQQPLSRGIERFTGITQAMVDSAPPPGQALTQLAERMRGRVLVAHAPCPARRHDLRQDPVRTAPAPVRLRGHGGRGRRRPALRPPPGQPPAARRAPADRPDLRHLPDDPGVYVFRDERGRPLYVGKSVSLCTRARAHFCAPAGWTERAEIVDYRATNSELGALVLENRLIKQWRPTHSPPRAPIDLRADRPLLLSLPGRPRPQRLPAPGGRGAGPLRRTPRRGGHAAG